MEKIDKATTAKMMKTAASYEKKMLQRFGSVSKKISNDSDGLLGQLRNSNKLIAAMKETSEVCFDSLVFSDILSYILFLSSGKLSNENHLFSSCFNPAKSFRIKRLTQHQERYFMI